MGARTSGDRDGRRPSHFVFKIESFSVLVENGIESYESGEFEAGGYKWKLILHPNGNKNKDIDDHISLYLKAVADEGSVKPEWEVHATFVFFLYDQINDNYLVIQDESKAGRRFYKLKSEWGIDRLVSLEDFHNPVDGFLVNDTCVFGAEVYVHQVTGKGEYLSMEKDPVTHKYTWKVENFSTLVQQQTSPLFTAGSQNWKILLYPKGDISVAGNFVSVYLELAGTQHPSGSRVLAKYTLSILDQLHGKHHSKQFTYWFGAPSSGLGKHEFVPMSEMSSPTSGYLKDGKCIVEAEVTVLGVVTAL